MERGDMGIQYTNIKKRSMSKDQKFDEIKKIFAENKIEESNLNNFSENMKLHEKEFHKYAKLLGESQNKIIENLKKASDLTK